MVVRRPLDAYQHNVDLCQRELASSLCRGELGLALGAGASCGMGLPPWHELVKRCARSLDEPPDVDDNTPNDELMKIMSRVEDESKSPSIYRDLVRNAMYESCLGDDSLLESKLLAVIGAMIVPSRRGSVSEVITLNFDDVLERCLGLHGFSSQIITGLPALMRNADATVYHPHGYLPSRKDDELESEEIVFSKLSFEKFLADRLNVWKDLVREFLLRRMVLFVGLSDSSLSLSAILTSIIDVVRKQRGPTGFWLLGPNDPPGSEIELMQRNVVPIRCSGYDEYWRFMLRVCQQAQASREPHLANEGSGASGVTA